MRRAVVIVLFAAAACATRAAPPAASHPASVTAPTGRLAGAPPSLRAGAIAYPEVPPVRAAAEPGHHHHHTP